MDFSTVDKWKVVDPQTKYRTGDIILFSGSGLSSTIIKTFTHSVWSHIGLVCWIELVHFNGYVEVDLFSFELGSRDYIDLMSDKLANKKVRLVRLNTILPMYDLVAIRKLKLPVRTPKESRRWCKKFQKFALKNQGLPFFDIPTTLSTHFVGPGAEKNQTTCAQIAAEMLKTLKVYKHDFDTSQLNPEAFCHRQKVFPGDIFDGKEIVIYRDKQKVKARLMKVMISIIVLIIVIMIVVLWRRNVVKRRRNKA